MERLCQRGKGNQRLAGPARQQLRGGPQARWEASRVESPRLLELTGTAPGGGRATATNRFEAAGAGTDITIEIEYELPGGFVGGIADKLVVERAIERDVKHSVENFKAICEAEVQVPA